MLNSHFSPIKPHSYLACRALDDANLTPVLIENRRHRPLSRMLTPALEHRIARFLKRPIREGWNIIPSETLHLRNEPVMTAQASKLNLGDIVPSPVVEAGVLPKQRVREIDFAILVAGMRRFEQLRHRKVHRRFAIQFDPRSFTQLFITSLI